MAEAKERESIKVLIVTWNMGDALVSFTVLHVAVGIADWP